MKLSKLLHQIFEFSELKDQPPVLIDIGASESMHKYWKQISRYSIGIAFEADNREIGYTEKITNDFRKLFVFNCIVTDNDEETTTFFLTESPFCSSTLQPYSEKLAKWAYAEKFKVVNQVRINSKSLMSSLKEINIKNIDWFKSDSQGIDLRLFKSLSESLRNKIIVAEFEPGLIDSYMGEDKLSELINYFETEKFWLSDFTLKGSQKLTQAQLDNIFSSGFLKKLAQFSHKTSPGWAEIIYIREFQESSSSVRELILGWIFSTILDQHGYALLLAERLMSTSEGDTSYEKIIKEMINYSRAQIRRNILDLGSCPSFYTKLKSILRVQ